MGNLSCSGNHEKNTCSKHEFDTNTLLCFSQKTEVKMGKQWKLTCTGHGEVGTRDCTDAAGQAAGHVTVISVQW